MHTIMLLLTLSSPTQDSLRAMELREGAAYLEARAQLLERGLLAELEARRARSRYSAESWRSDVIADVAHFWSARKADAERAYALEGLDPRFYLRRRKPEPEAARELVRLDAAPIAFEMLLKTMDRYPLQTERERIALKEAIVIALGESSHPAAAHALAEIARDDRFRASLRGLAVRNLRTESELIEWLDGPIVEVRRGAVQGLGGIRTRRSIAALIEATNDPELRLTAIRALGSAASPRLLEREKNQDAELIRSEASRALIRMLASPHEDADADALVETIALVRHPSAIAELAKLERSNESNRSIARARRRLQRALER